MATAFHLDPEGTMLWTNTMYIHVTARTETNIFQVSALPNRSKLNSTTMQHEYQCYIYINGRVCHLIIVSKQTQSGKE